MSNNDTQFDIVIIGAGAAGLSAGYFLSRSARVAVLEQEAQTAYHTSGRSAAMYIEGYENGVVQALTSAGKDFFFAPPEGFCESKLVSRKGGMTAAGHDDLDGLQRYLQAWQPTCPELVELSAEQARDIVPMLRQDWLAAAAYDPSWHNIDVHELLSGFQRGIRRNGGVILTNHKVSGLKRHGAGWQIDSAGGQLQAQIVINAAGAWAAQVGALAGAVDQPLAPKRRTALIIPAPDNATDWPLVHTVQENLYFKPESPGLMICPQDETPSEPMDAYPLELDVAVAMDRFSQIADHEVSRVMHQWAGLRTFAPDRRPIVGFDPQASGFFWLAGQGGFGIQTSPGLGELTARIIAGELAPEAAIDAGRFR